MGSRKRVSRAERVLDERLIDELDSPVGEIPVYSISMIDDETWAAIRFINKVQAVDCPNYGCEKWGIQVYPCSTKNFKGCQDYKLARETGKIDEEFKNFMRNINYIEIYVGNVKKVKSGMRLSEICPEITGITITGQ